MIEYLANYTETDYNENSRNPSIVHVSNVDDPPDFVGRLLISKKLYIFLSLQRLIFVCYTNFVEKLVFITFD